MAMSVQLGIMMSKFINPTIFLSNIYTHIFFLWKHGTF